MTKPAFRPAFYSAFRPALSEFKSDAVAQSSFIKGGKLILSGKLTNNSRLWG